MELCTNPLDYTKCADLMISRSNTFIYKCIYCRNIAQNESIFVEHLPTCCPSLLNKATDDNVSTKLRIFHGIYFTVLHFSRLTQLISRKLS